jgi:hypothetical protein
MAARIRMVLWRERTRRVVGVMWRISRGRTMVGGGSTSTCGWLRRRGERIGSLQEILD